MPKAERFGADGRELALILVAVRLVQFEEAESVEFAQVRPDEGLGTDTGR